jgi:ProQ/FINO family
MSQGHNQAATAAIVRLAELYPKCFSVYEGRRRPLKIGIHKDILAAADELLLMRGANVGLVGGVMAITKCRIWVNASEPFHTSGETDRCARGRTSD